MKTSLCKIVPEKNQYRFYNLIVAPTLFGEWSLIREWGRIGRPGTVRQEWFRTESEAMAASEKMKSKRFKRGYRDRQPQLDS